MKSQLRIWNYNHTKKVDVPPSCMRLCAQCLNPMRLDRYFWMSETEVDMAYVCEHRQTSRYKVVSAKLDKKGRLS